MHRFVSCTFEHHARAILEILNEAIVHSTALYDYHPRDRASMVRWFDAKTVGSAAGPFPVIGAVDESGTLLGFATYGSFRAFPAYKYTVEHSVYVHVDHRGRGLGRALLQQVIASARAQGFHVMVGAIDAANDGSLALHASLGFERAGTVRQAGFKFGRWLDLALVQLVLDGSPPQPVDD